MHVVHHHFNYKPRDGPYSTQTLLQYCCYGANGMHLSKHMTRVSAQALFLFVWGPSPVIGVLLCRERAEGCCAVVAVAVRQYVSRSSPYPVARRLYQQKRTLELRVIIMFLHKIVRCGFGDPRKHPLGCNDLRFNARASLEKK